MANVLTGNLIFKSNYKSDTAALIEAINKKFDTINETEIKNKTDDKESQDKDCTAHTRSPEPL